MRRCLMTQTSTADPSVDDLYRLKSLDELQAAFNNLVLSAQERQLGELTLGMLRRTVAAFRRLNPSLDGRLQTTELQNITARDVSLLFEGVQFGQFYELAKQNPGLCSEIPESVQRAVETAAAAASKLANQEGRHLQDIGKLREALVKLQEAHRFFKSNPKGNIGQRISERISKPKK